MAPYWSKKRSWSHRAAGVGRLTPPTEVSKGVASTNTATFTAMRVQVTTGLRRSGLRSWTGRTTASALGVDHVEGLREASGLVAGLRRLGSHPVAQQSLQVVH